MTNSRKTSYVLLIRRISIVTTLLLFGVLAVRVTLDIGKSKYLLSEKFGLELLKKRGPLISKPFQVSNKPRFYRLNFTSKFGSYTSNPQLLVNVKLVNSKNKVINNFDIDFSEKNKKSYRRRYLKKYFKSNKNEQLYVVMKLLKSNIKKVKSTYSYRKNSIRVGVYGADDDIPNRFYYRVFIYSFFIMIVMLFVPSRLF